MATTKQWRLRSIVCGALVAGAVGCGDDSAQPSETIVVPPTDTAGSVSLDAEPPTTRSLITAAPSTSSTSTTTAVAATGDPASAVLAVVGHAEEAYLEALRDPESDGAGAIEAATAAGSPVRDELVGRYRSRVSAGFVLEPNPATPFEIIVEGEVVQVGEDLASVTVCVVDGDVLLRRSTSAEGAEERVVVDDIVSAGRFHEEFVREAGVWRLASRTLIDVYEGEESCA